MRAIVEQVRPLLQSSGFRKRKHTFNRTVEAGLVHVVNIMMGTFDPPGTVEIPGMRPNVYGLFAVSFGVFVEEAWRLETGRFGPDGPPAEKRWVTGPDCQVRHRVSNPAADRTSSGWWPLDDPDVGAVLAERLRHDVLARFDLLASRSAILSALESAPVGSRDVSGIGGPDRLLAVRMRLGAGDREGAQRNLDAWVAHCRADAAPHVRGHLEFLARFTAEVGLTMPAAVTAP